MRYRAMNKKEILRVVREYTIYIAFLLVVIFFAITLRGKGFFTAANALNIIRQTAALTIMGVGLTSVISTGGIDLSIGSTVGLSSLIAAIILREGGNILLAFLGGAGIGLMVGACNGFLYAKLKMPAFISTLAVSGIVYGIGLLPTQSSPVPIADTLFNNIFGSGNIGPVPILLIWMAAAVVLGHLMLRHMKYGRQVLAVGGNEISAKYSGINTEKIKFLVMLFCGLMAGIAGCLYAGRMHTGRCTFGEGAETQVITGVVLGGTIMSGGKGSIIGTLIGSLMIGMISNGLVIMGLNVAQQKIVQGIILLLAIAFGIEQEREA